MIDQLREWVDACLNEGRHLTKWEEGFLYHVEEKLTLGEPVTEREREKVEEIWREKVA